MRINVCIMRRYIKRMKRIPCLYACFSLCIPTSIYSPNQATHFCLLGTNKIQCHNVSLKLDVKFRLDFS